MLLAWWLLSTAASAAPRLVRVHLDAWPPDARLSVAIDSWRFAGRCSEVIPLTFPQSGVLRVRLEATGYAPQERDLDLSAMQALPDGTWRWPSPIELTPDHAWIINALTTVRLHPAATTAALLLLLAGLLGAFHLAFGSRKALRRARALEALRSQAGGGVDVGLQFGRWRTVGRLGRGGMGRVYRAVPEATFPEGSAVAIKVARPDRRERFDREAQVGMHLVHPHLVSVLETGVEQGVPFLVMPVEEGETLSAMLERGPWPHAFVPAFRSLVEAIAYAHRQGVLHRDLKPSNVMCGPTGSLKVLDFGLATVVGQETTVGAGTPGYMAPESEVSPAADQYALGRIGLEMWGDRPVPEPVRAVLERMTADQPDARYPSLDAVLAALDQ